jgi:hypothetical protein
MSSVRRRICTLFLCLSFVPSISAQAPFADESPEKSNLREVIFRYMFEHYNYGSYVKVFCIQPEQPQPERFLLRFADSRPRVVWASDCEPTGPMNALKKKKTGESGMRMTVISIRWIGGQEAEAKVEAFSDGIAANWNTLRILFKEGRWIVKSDKVDAVS